MTKAKQALIDRAETLDHFGQQARERLCAMALRLVEGLLRDDPCRAPDRPDEIASQLQRMQAESEYIRAHHVAAYELRLLADN